MLLKLVLFPDLAQWWGWGVDRRSQTFCLFIQPGAYPGGCWTVFATIYYSLQGGSSRLKSVGPAVNASSGREKPQRANGPLSGLSRGLLGTTSSLDWALALGSSPSAALSALAGDTGASVSLPTVPLPPAKRLTPESAAAFNLSLLWRTTVSYGSPRTSGAAPFTVGFPLLPLSSVMSNRCLWPWRAFWKHQWQLDLGPFRENSSKEGPSRVSWGPGKNNIGQRQAATCLSPPVPFSRGSRALGDSEGKASGAVACRLKSDSEHSSFGGLLQIYKEPLKHVKYETAG